ncbi:MarR family winged helix-turn-helix transcriptional regulator [Faunimonas sp. B44]|uniref:MarR family winged helix-turn-helix transcriptional regulator n=1 Tax=Faunimonas sp. B44 TaxID=3461493 RepID=UPI00404471EE
MDQGPAADTTANLVFELARLFRRRMDEVLSAERIEVTPAEGRALLRIARAEPIRQSALAEQMGVEPMTLSGLLDRLERAGLIVRATDPADRRAKLVRTRPEASALIDRIEAVAGRLREQAAHGLGPAERETARRVLARMRKNLSAEILEPA